MKENSISLPIDELAKKTLQFFNVFKTKYFFLKEDEENIKYNRYLNIAAQSVGFTNYTEFLKSKKEKISIMNYIQKLKNKLIHYYAERGYSGHLFSDKIDYVFNSFNFYLKFNEEQLKDEHREIYTALMSENEDIDFKVFISDFINKSNIFDENIMHNTLIKYDLNEISRNNLKYFFYIKNAFIAKRYKNDIDHMPFFHKYLFILDGLDKFPFLKNDNFSILKQIRFEEVGSIYGNLFNFEEESRVNLFTEEMNKAILFYELRNISCFSIPPILKNDSINSIMIKVIAEYFMLKNGNNNYHKLTMLNLFSNLNKRNFFIISKDDRITEKMKTINSAKKELIIDKLKCLETSHIIKSINDKIIMHLNCNIKFETFEDILKVL